MSPPRLAHDLLLPWKTRLKRTWQPSVSNMDSSSVTGIHWALNMPPDTQGVTNHAKKRTRTTLNHAGQQDRQDEEQKVPEPPSLLYEEHVDSVVANTFEGREPVPTMVPTKTVLQGSDSSGNDTDDDVSIADLLTRRLSPSQSLVPINTNTQKRIHGERRRHKSNGPPKAYPTSANSKACHHNGEVSVPTAKGTPPLP